MTWHFADLWELVAAELPDAPALIERDRRISWRELDRRSDGLARFLLDAGLRQGEKVAQFLANGPEYVETAFAAFKVGFVPVNANFVDDDLVHVLASSDSAAVVFHARLTGTLEGVRPHAPGVRIWLCVDDGSGPCPDWASPYEEAAATDPGTTGVQGPRPRSPDDHFLFYTGGTTGAPKAVVWRHEDLFLTANQSEGGRFPIAGTLEDAAALLRGSGPTHLPVCPLIHGFGSIPSFTALSAGGSIVTLPGERLDPIELLDTVARERVVSVALTGGDAMGKPILDALEAAPGAWDLSSLRTIMSSGAMFSAEVKRGLVRHGRRLAVMDALGSTETSGMAWSVTSTHLRTETATFRVNRDSAVITEDGRFVKPGSSELGLLAKRTKMAIGYYQDDARSESAHRVVDGVRWLTPGDLVRVDANGSIRLFGRGSNSIRTGAGRIFAEQVEEVLKQHPMVRDAAALGIPDRQFEAVVAIVQPELGSTPSSGELIEFMQAEVESHMVPRTVVIVPSMDRLYTGKNDYKRWRAHVAGLPAGNPRSDQPRSNRSERID
jgi:3-oxocholest-4-en-26-oate---CoA ligase